MEENFPRRWRSEQPAAPVLCQTATIIIWQIGAIITRNHTPTAPTGDRPKRPPIPRRHNCRRPPILRRHSAPLLSLFHIRTPKSRTTERSPEVLPPSRNSVFPRYSQRPLMDAPKRRAGGPGISKETKFPQNQRYLMPSPSQGDRMLRLQPPRPIPKETQFPTPRANLFPEFAPF